MCDFDARSNIGGDSITNNHGNIIENLLTTSDVCLLNNGLPTHFHIQTNTESCIDLTIVSPGIWSELTWNVSEDLYNGDHYPILIKRTQNLAPPTPLKTYNF